MNENLTNYIRATTEAFVDKDRGDASVLWDELRNENTPAFDKTVALFRLLRLAIPEAIDDRMGYDEFFRDTKSLPIDPDEYTFEGKIGRGMQNDVFLLQSTNVHRDSYILKVNHRIQKSVPELVEYASSLNSRIQEVRDIYSDLPKIVPAQLVLLINNPQKYTHKYAVAVIRKFAAGRVRDLFSELSSEESARLVADDPEFADTLKRFTLDTNRYLEKSNRVVDLIGRRNIAVVSEKIEDEEKNKLMLLDSDFIIDMQGRSEKVTNAVIARIQYLNDLASGKRVEPISA